MSYIDKHLSGEAKAKLGKEALFKRVNWYKLKQVAAVLAFLLALWFWKDSSSHTLLEAMLGVLFMWGLYELVLKFPLFVFLFGYVIMRPWHYDSGMTDLAVGGVIMTIGLLSALLKHNREEESGNV